jgi:hypothetical protein
MDWQEYTALCNRPDIWSRWMIEQSIEVLEQLEQTELQVPLRDALGAPPFGKPADHKGGAEVNMYRVSCAIALRKAILDAMVVAKEAGMTTSGTRTRGLGGFEEAWREYSNFAG